MSTQPDRSGASNPFFGKTHTPEAKAKMAEATRRRQTGTKKSPETREKIRLANIRTKAKKAGIPVDGVPDADLEAFVTAERAKRDQPKPDPWESSERRAGASLRMKKRWSEPAFRDQMIATKRAFSHSPESKAKIAAANTKRKGVFKHSEETKQKISRNSVWRAKKGDFTYLGWTETRKGQPKPGQTKIGFRSKWEQRAMLLLDECSSVLSFQYEPLGVPYVWEGKQRFTIPDFLVTMTDGSIVMVEIKPRGFTYNAKERAKAAACSQFCALSGWKYEVWDERRLWPGLSQSEVRGVIRRMT